MKACTTSHLYQMVDYQQKQQLSWKLECFEWITILPKQYFLKFEGRTLFLKMTFDSTELEDITNYEPYGTFIWSGKELFRLSLSRNPTYLKKRLVILTTSWVRVYLN